MIFNIKNSLVALAAVSTVLAQHPITIYNYCGQEKYGHIKSAAFDYVSGLLGTNGGSYEVTVPALASSLIVFGESGECPGVDGPGCTRLECDFSNPAYQQCNLSRVSGFTIPLAWSWTDGSCTGGHCESATASTADCWAPNSNDGSSLRQCNTANVGGKYIPSFLSKCHELIQVLTPTVNLYLCGA
ncbi:hypothetical protein FRB94_006623 [Tulasnella sp. JGI-2019a]|nr:hypothetical protein FRB93_001918 [Tulasnella sp. JGI-2019a]KAG8998822.1 hypothetical protein FRB94_006623 [Tulasnella sp. JGI-2019a]KAG9030438.1 hypothetical protein FRB95_003944 [Tulasnella sp. JGI-2019a]